MAVCPLITICKEQVTYEHYSQYCVNITEDKYKECPKYQELSRVKKTPMEWRSLIFPATARR